MAILPLIFFLKSITISFYYICFHLATKLKTILQNLRHILIHFEICFKESRSISLKIINVNRDFELYPMIISKKYFLKIQLNVFQFKMFSIDRAKCDPILEQNHKMNYQNKD